MQIAFQNSGGGWRYTEPIADQLDLTNVDGFIQLLSLLCGQEVNLICRLPNEDARCQKCPECINFSLLDSLVVTEGHWDHPRFNQALLLLNQPTVSASFFSLFFDTGGTVTELKQGIINFRGIAMLVFGNFRFAYKQLAPLGSISLGKSLDGYLASPEDVIAEYKSRRRAVSVKEISDNQRWYLGYISGARLSEDQGSSDAVLCHLGILSKEEIEESHTDQLQRDIFLRRFAELSGRDLQIWEESSDVGEKLAKINTDLLSLQGIGWANTVEYLTSDYLDVYIATSMRESWEYQSTAEFARAIFNIESVEDLQLRYFDPTLSFLKNRIDKGLVEGLMLRRAKCTLYMVQESDTLGKDSELASTLAQGKPVIAYVPNPSQAELEEFLQSMPLRFIEKRAMLYLAEDLFGHDELKTIIKFLQNAAEFNPVFELVGEEENEFMLQHKDQLSNVRKAISVAEVEYYDKRARTLAKSHPLGIQMHLDTGVANGVLVTRSLHDCAKLLVSLLTNQAEFSIEEEDGTTVLREKISNCAYRVVTNDPTVTNSFWNFYLS